MRLLCFLLAGPPFGVSLSWHCSLLVAVSTLARAPSAAVLAPGVPAPSAIWMLAKILFNALLTLGGCVFFAPPSPVLTFAQSVQLALQSAGDAQRAIPKTQLAPPHRPVSLLRRLRPLRPPPPGFPPLPPGFYQSCPPRGPPRYPCSICFLEVGGDSLKCSTCSRWVHFSCSSLTRADFRKICAAGSPMGWNCPACLNGDLASPALRPAFPRLFSPAPPPHTPSTCLLRSQGFISASPLTSSPP